MEPLLGSRLHPIRSYLIEIIFAIGPFQIFCKLSAAVHDFLEQSCTAAESLQISFDCFRSVARHDRWKSTEIIKPYYRTDTLNHQKSSVHRSRKLSSNRPEAALYRRLSPLIVRQTRRIAPITRNHHYRGAIETITIITLIKAITINLSKLTGACCTTLIRIPIY